MSKEYGPEQQRRLLSYIKKMRDRYPGLSERQMALRADLPNNAIYRIRDGVRPRPATLSKLAEEWGRDATERSNDFRELMGRAGYVVPPDEMRLSEDERKWVQRFRDLDEDQRELAALFFRAYGAGDTIDILARGLITQMGEPSPSAEKAFLEFLEILREVTSLTAEERIALIGEALRRFRSSGSPDDNQERPSG